MSAEAKKTAAEEVLEVETVVTPTAMPERMLLGVIAEEATTTEPAEETPIPGVPTEQITEEPRLATGEEIHKALQTLISLQTSVSGEVSEGEPGDIFLCYDISMRVRGEKDLHIVDRTVLHRALLPEGLPSAPSEMEGALFTIIKPFKHHLMGIIGRLTTAGGGSIPQPTLKKLK